MASSLYILDLKGKVLISRDYKGDVPSNAIDKFVNKVIKTEEEHNVKPIFEDDGYSFCYVQHRNIYIVVITASNANVIMIMNFIHRLIEVFKHYFKEVEEESIKDNFVVVYELLDEMMDNGYPQATDPKILQEFIKGETHKLNIDTKAIMNAFGSGFSVAGLQGVIAQNIGAITQAVAQNIGSGFGSESDNTAQKVTIPKHFTFAVNWRDPNIKYAKNEVFLDVIENVNILVGNNGQTIRSEIIGCLKMRCHLTGMPELKLGLNDKVLFENLGRSVAKGRAVELEDVKFHQCVRLNRFETDRTISFIPPDGDFDLMSYRLNTKVKPLIAVECVPELHSNTRIVYAIKAKAQFKKRSTANNVEIIIPVPKDADTPDFKANVGTANYAPEKDAIIWTIKQFQGGKEFYMKAQVGLPSITAESNSYLEMKKRPISVKFDIPYFTVSGLQVRYLKIMEKSGYQALPWVRYITQSGDYQIRQG